MSYVVVPNFWGESGEAREILVPDIADDGFGDGLPQFVGDSVERGHVGWER